MGRPSQNLPRALRGPKRLKPARQATGFSHKTRWALAGAAVLLFVAVFLATLVLWTNTHTPTHTIPEARAHREVAALLRGIPQHASTLGRPTAPATLEIYADLKDPDSRNWFLLRLPAILHDDVRTGLLKLQYNGFKTNTYYPQEYVREQTAALAAAAQNRLWNYIETFFYERRGEFETYVTPTFLQSIARQVPGLNLAQWDTDRHTGRREERATAEDQAARALGLHVTPSFRIGPNQGPLKTFSGHAIVKYGEQHPISLIEAKDVDRALKELHISAPATGSR